MKKHVLHFNELEFEKQKSKALAFIDAAQRILTLHYKLGNLFPIDDISHFAEIKNEGALFCKKRIVQNLETPIISGFKMRKESLIDTLEFPPLTEYDAVKTWPSSLFLDEGQGLCRINDSLVELDPDKVEIMKEIHTLYAKSEEEVKVLNAHVAAATAINNLNYYLKKANKPGISLDDTYSELFSLNDHNLSANYSYYLTQKWYK